MGRWRGGGGGGIDHVSRSVSRRGTTCVFRAHALGGRADGARTDRVAYADRPLKTRTPRRGVTAAVTLKNDGGPRRAYYVPTLLNYARVMCRSLSGPLPPPPRNRTPRTARARTAANSSGRSARTPFTTRREIRRDAHYRRACGPFPAPDRPGFPCGPVRRPGEIGDGMVTAPPGRPPTKRSPTGVSAKKKPKITKKSRARGGNPFRVNMTGRFFPRLNVSRITEIFIFFFF